MAGLWRRILQRHAELKHTIHNTKIPLSRGGQWAAGFFYFLIPMPFGYAAYHWSMAQRDANLGMLMAKEVGNPTSSLTHGTSPPAL